MARKVSWRRMNPDVSVEAGEYPWQPVAIEEEPQSTQTAAQDTGSESSGDGGSDMGESDAEDAWSESDLSAVDEEVEGVAIPNAPSMAKSGPGAPVDAMAISEELEAKNELHARGVRFADTKGDYKGSGDDKEAHRPGLRSQLPASYLWFASDSTVTEKGDVAIGQEQVLTEIYGIQRRILIPKGQHGVHVDGDQVMRDLVKLQLPPAPAKRPQLEAKNAVPAVSENSSVWVILATNGGFFAGAVFDNRSGSIVAHKTFQRYTTRRKQGGSQARNDSTMGRAAKSAGAQIRRYNEQKLQEEIQELMQLWKEYLQSSTCVFVRVPRTQHRGFFGPAGDVSAQVMQWSDPRIRSIPVAMARPSLLELQRVYRDITTVKVRMVDAAALAAPKPDTGAGALKAAEAARADQDEAAAGQESEESDHTLEPEPRPDLLALLFHVAKMILDESQPDQQIIDYLNSTMARFLDALSDPAVGLRYLEDTDALKAHRTPTLLHLASQQGRVELVPFLMDHGEDPTITNGRPPLYAGGLTAYEIAKDRPTRDAFRVYKFEHSDDRDLAFEWQRARIPAEPLSREKQQENESKAREKKRREREKRKAKEKERKGQQTRAKSEAEAADEKALSQAFEEKNRIASSTSTRGSLKDNIHSFSGSELRARMLNMAYASAGAWGAATSSSEPSRASGSVQDSTGQRPVSPGTQRAVDRELRFQAAQRRQQQLQQPADGAAAASGTYGNSSSLGKRIVRGFEVPAQLATSIVSISIGSRPGSDAFCGGVLISPTHVATASHCLNASGRPALAKNVRVGYGSNDRQKHRFVTATKVTMDPRYFESDVSDGGYEVSIIEVPRIEASATTQRALLYGGLLAESQRLLVMGWGATESGAVGNDKLRGTIPVVGSKGGVCNREPGARKDINGPLICTLVDLTPGQSTCHGDSGSGLMINDGGMLKLVGLVFGAWNGVKDTCDDRGKINTYASTRYHLAFISQSTGLPESYFTQG
ncbi:hypothetical protein GGI07_001149 [Coemansia sp. Benny D115]|nr:hypothetical protein GGI07_001149 [Coemansia sp. Benny D115]